MSTATETVEIKNRLTGAVLFAATIACAPTDSIGVRLGMAVKQAVSSGANLSRAYLSDANLSDANLSRADLSRVNLSGADLSRANLSGAYLSGANLSGAYLSGADLSGADLSDADLSGANLSGANLSGADLSRANLSGAYLSGANLSGAYLSRANLSRAYLSGANLSGAYLSGADLSDADLSRVNLSGANLSGADLSRANLSGAYLSGAKGYIPEFTTHLASLKLMPTVHAFKVVDDKGEGHINGGLRYVVGERIEEPDANTDVNETCSRGIHLADLPWCLREWREGYRILLIEHSPDDIAAIPLGTDGKYRVKGCTPVRDVTDELRACGALPALQTAKAA